MDAVTGDIRAPGGVVGTGARLRDQQQRRQRARHAALQLKDADIQAAEEPFEAAGQQFERGSFLIRGVPDAELDARDEGSRPEGDRRSPRRRA